MGSSHVSNAFSRLRQSNDPTSLEWHAFLQRDNFENASNACVSPLSPVHEARRSLAGSRFPGRSLGTRSSGSITACSAICDLYGSADKQPKRMAGPRSLLLCVGVLWEGVLWEGVLWEGEAPAEPLRRQFGRSLTLPIRGNFRGKLVAKSSCESA
jgi:hypothetical protein